MSPDSTQDLWPKWMWVAVPVLVVVVVAGLWWAIFGGDDGGSQLASATATPTLRPIAGQPTQAPTLQPTLAILIPTATGAPVLPTVAAPTQAAVQTPTAAPTPTGGMAIGDRAQVTGSNGVLNMRDGAGTGFKIVGSLRDGAIVEILDGPKEANGYTWWQVRNDAGLTGWAAGDWLKKVN